MVDMPTGTVTFLFTDIEGSTRLWEQHPEAMRDALARHDALLRQAIETHGGHVFKTMGDQFCAAFALNRAAPAMLVDRCVRNRGCSSARRAVAAGCSESLQASLLVPFYLETFRTPRTGAWRGG